jgi:hypothetical protein
MPFNSNITPGRPPVLWSDVNDAFIKVNENFDILVATIGDGSGLTPVDFTSLDTAVKPTTDNLYGLGDITHRWKSVYTGEHTVADPLNGLWAGNAQIKGVGFTVNLPASSTIGGDPVTGVGADLIIDPAKTFFKEIQVNNDLSVVAMEFGDTVNLLQGSGISLAVSSGADSITFSNTGILSVAAGSGISSTTASGVATITNAGVRSLQNVSSLPTGRTAGAGIYINSATGDNLKITNAGVISVSSGVGITVSLDAASGDVTITNSAPAGNTFAQVEVNGDSSNRLAADSNNDVLNINSGEGITLTKTVGTDTLNIAVNPVFDLKGSIFGDDSTKIVDAVENKVYGGIFATTLRTAETKIALGENAGLTSQGSVAVAIGAGAGESAQGSGSVSIGVSSGSINQGANAVAIGRTAGFTTQGANAVAIGESAGQSSQPANSIVINASGVVLNGAAAGFYVRPIRSNAAGRIAVYDTATYEVSYTNLEVNGSTLSTNDSSGMVVDVLTTFNSDVVVENELRVDGQVTIGGDLIINGTTTTINSVTLTVDDKNIELGSTASPTDVTADGGGITLKGSTDKTFNYVNSTGVWTANIGVQATSFTGLAAAATTASTAASVGYMGIPQSATATTATLVIGDAGKHIYVTTNSQTITIPANSVVPYPVGTAITFVAGPSATTMTIANNDTMYLVGAGTSGSRTLAAYGTATAIKVAATTWFINGSGLT